MLNEYVAEFQSLRAELEGLLQSVASGGDSFAATDSKLRELKDCLEAFEMELRSMPASERSSHLSQLQICRDEFARLQRRCLLATSRGHEPSASAELKRGNQALERLNSATAQVMHENSQKKLKRLVRISCATYTCKGKAYSERIVTQSRPTQAYGSQVP
ncbi:hypothetical protein, conserved [Eimeria acervulina]|uniref:Vesicle transport v-SNARE N-terminal domain-containing protein n=1 Tax=Eimeria acervulina TaxID=5801 RepID=U6GGW9_EIMAC|nr:hypothetical protein, conserved [Eimeria acervulina]CDI78812.1 hypothetical protein, conserved [Eimeria acervulina]